MVGANLCRILCSRSLHSWHSLRMEVNKTIQDIADCHGCQMLLAATASICMYLHLYHLRQILPGPKVCSICMSAIDDLVALDCGHGFCPSAM